MYGGDDRAAAATAAAAAVGDGVLRATNAVLESQRATIADMMTKNSSLSSRLGIAEHDLQRVRAVTGTLHSHSKTSHLKGLLAAERST
jgi:hypothetical protein